MALASGNPKVRRINARRITSGVPDPGKDNGSFIGVEEGRRISDAIGRGTPSNPPAGIPGRRELFAACHGKGADNTLRALKQLYLKSPRCRLTLVEECRCACKRCRIARKRGAYWTPMHFEDIATPGVQVPLEPVDARFEVDPSVEQLI